MVIRNSKQESEVWPHEEVWRYAATILQSALRESHPFSQPGGDIIKLQWDKPSKNLLSNLSKGSTALPYIFVSESHF